MTKMVSAHGQEGKTQMKNDLINRQQAIDAVMELIEAGIEWRSGVSSKIRLLNAVYCALEGIPSVQSTVDAVPVVRCEQCTWWNVRECMFWAGEGMYTEYYDYCSRGKRREDVAK